jgi:hypothetical protein
MWNTPTRFFTCSNRHPTKVSNVIRAFAKQSSNIPEDTVATVISMLFYLLL